MTSMHTSTVVVGLLLASHFCGCAYETREDTRTTEQQPAANSTSHRVPEDWISKPQTEWPQIVLTNDAEFKGHTPLIGASGFLIQTEEGRIFAATAAHLIGSAGGVEPEISVGQLNGKIRSWRMFPRTMEDDFVEIDSVGIEGLDGANLDWLVLSLREGGELPAYPLKLRAEPVKVGEKVYLIGCPYVEENCRQNVYRGTVTQRKDGGLFRYALEPPVDIRGFSGAPIIDADGYLVGVMTVWFDPRMSGEKYLEGGGEDVSSIYHLLHSAR